MCFKKAKCNFDKLIIRPEVRDNFTILYSENLEIGDYTVINGDVL